MGDDEAEQVGANGGASLAQSDDGDFDRDLGVIEAITWVTRSCPSGVVVRLAEQALETIKAEGAGVMKQQAYHVLSALQGWRGERARQVHRSLTRYLEAPTAEAEGAGERSS